MLSRLFPVPTFINGTGTGSGTTVSPHRSSNRNLIFMPPALQRRRISVTCAVSNSQQNHYAVLGVSAEATTSDIKKAYRLLARKYHPDVNKDSQASEMFKGIHLAYEVLSNKTTRQKYDNTLINKRHLFTQLLKFRFFSIFLLKTIGAKLLLAFSSLMALLDPKLHGGYKLGLRYCMGVGG